MTRRLAYCLHHSSIPPSLPSDDDWNRSLRPVGAEGGGGGGTAHSVGQDGLLKPPQWLRQTALVSAPDPAL